MSALARLAALASGRASSRLRPVLPARFEPGGFGEEEFSERHDETPAPPATAPDRAAEPVPQTLAPPAGPRTRAAPSGPPAGRTLAPETPEAASKAPPAPLIDVPEPTLRDVQSASTDPAMPAPDALPPPQPSGRKEQLAPHAPVAPFATAPAVSDAAPPPPLLPPAPRPGFDPEPAPSAAKSDRRAPAAPAVSSTPPAPPPEITIHIGRIELREAAPPPRERPRPERRAPQVTPLGDYLKGGSG